MYLGRFRVRYLSSLASLLSKLSIRNWFIAVISLDHIDVINRETVKTIIDLLER